MSVSVHVTTAQGDLLPRYHGGKTYVEAEPGQSYTLVLGNHSSQRKLVVLTVDGLNTITGKVGSYADPGWVLEPGQTARIEGWKLDSESAAAFTFGGKNESYAAKTGHGTKNVGIIGAAVFDEKNLMSYWQGLGNFSSGITSGSGGGTWSSGGPPQVYASHSHSTTDLPTAGTLSVKSSSVGTQFGQKTEMRSSSTTFSRASTAPSSVVVLHYGTRADLKRWGVPLDVQKPSPQAFPGEGCTPPAGWQG